MAKTSNKLTNNDLKSLAVGQAAYGSNLRATRNKSGITFHACFTIDGERHLHRLGNSKNLSLTDAIRAAAEYRVKQEREHELKRDGGAESDMTFAEAAPMYLGYLRNNHGKNIVAKEQHFRLHILPALGGEKIRLLYTGHVKRFCTQLRGKGLTQGTVNRVLASLNDFYSHAKMERWLHVRPYEIKISNLKFQGRSNISAENQLKMMSVAKEPDQHPMIYFFLLIGFSVGMRHREILSIRWEHIDWEKGYVWLEQSKVGPRDQPLTETIIAELQRLKELRGLERGFVFASDKAKNGRIPRMNDQFSRVCVAAGLGDGITPHFMRHTCVTELVGRGCNDRTVAHFTGHKTASMISRYTHLDQTSPEVTAVMKDRGSAFISLPNN